MPGVVVGHIGDGSYDAVVDEFAVWNPDCRLGRQTVTGDVLLTSDRTRYFWIESGVGDVFLPKGTRTQEGDGKPLDTDYLPDTPPRDALDALSTLEESVETFHKNIRNPIKAIVARRRGDAFVGDIAGEIWLIVESGLEREMWTSNASALQALDALVAGYRSLGWSEKTRDGWEAVQPGDQLAVTPARPLRVRGEFRAWTIEVSELTETHTSPVRRLVHLRDTAGGCNFAFDAFRRLPLTWLVNTGTRERPDGLNAVNSHVVNIAAETSQTHYHPAEPIGGGKPQSEMYLVLDPKVYGLSTYGRTPWLTTFPDLNDLTVYETTPLRPGTTVYIQPNTGHRGVDAFVNVVTLPGFKPRNEIYIDQRIKDATDGRSPFNANVTV
jgi:hypothetical protein